MEHGSSLLAAWRKRRGYSQQEVADALRVRQSTVCDWEKGKKHPNINGAIRIEEISFGEVPIRSWRTGDPIASIGPSEEVEAEAGAA
jgi:transcriptional regulator with XRE-family HTH domain